MNMEFTDLAGISKPLSKLIGVLSDGMGALYRPTGIRRDADAQAYAIQVLTDAETAAETKRLLALAPAEANKLVVLAEAGLEIEERVRQRLTHQQLKRQINIEAVAAKAIEVLPEDVSPQPVDEQWKTRFFSAAEEISNDDMQGLWGKILAGEVSKPGSYSLRTLEILKNLSQDEARIFQCARYLSLDTGHILKASDNSAMPEFGLSYENILSLRAAGLLHDGDMQIVEMSIKYPPGFAALGYNGKALLFEPTNAAENLSIGQYMLTGVGKELLQLIDPIPQADYLDGLAKHLMASNCLLWEGYSGNPKETFKKISKN